MAAMYCQKCRTPLKLDSSLEDLNPAAFDLLVRASPQNPKHISPSRQAYPQERKEFYEKISKNAGSPLFKRSLTTTRTQDGASKTSAGNPAMSFVMLSESQVVPQSPAPIARSAELKNGKKASAGIGGVDGANDESKALSQEMERASRLFEILTARSDIDHPVCVECTTLLVEKLQKRLDIATKERDAYVGFLKQVNAAVPTAEEVADAETALKKAHEDEEAAIKELVQLEQEKAEVDAEIVALEEEAVALDAEEAQFWSERNSFAMKLAEFQNMRDSVNTQYTHDTSLLEKLQRTNVYNDTFCISHDGTFGTINGLRLGRLSSVPVDWPEINAAWGHTVLLLATVAERLGFKFHGYDLQPMGSTSRIFKHESQSTSSSTGSTRLSKKSTLNLYSSGDLPLGFTFMHRGFDHAMVAFLECMRQLGSFVENETSKANNGRVLTLPYKIDGEKIGNVSIKLGMGIAQDDAWSKACKYTLTCCKFLLAHTSDVTATSTRR